MSLHTQRITLADLRRKKAAGEPFAMLTAYDYPTAAAAQHAGVHALLIGDSMGTVLLGHENTRDVPLELMVILGKAVRAAAPNVFLIGDMPFGPTQQGDAAVLAAARRFRDEVGCQAVKIESAPEHDDLISTIVADGIDVVSHLGLRPQTVLSPDGYRAQARDADGIRDLVDDAVRMVSAGACMLLLEAVPNEATQAVVSSVEVPVIGCGAGPACDGHVVVTQDMLGIGAFRPPRFVPVLGNLGQQMGAAMREWVQSIADRRYPAPEHVYPLRQVSSTAPR